MSTFVRLYPRAWRDRYGAELEGLVASRPLGMRGAVDLLRGAFDAHLHPELADPAAAVEARVGLAAVSPERYEDLRVARRFGRAAWLGAVLWIAGWVIAANGPIVMDGDGGYRDGAAGAPFVLVALGLLAAGLLGQLVRLPRGSRIPRIGALIAIVAAPLWGLGPWILPLGLTALGGIVVFALGTWRSGQLGRPASLAILGSVLGGAAIVAWSIVGWDGDRLSAWNPMLLAVVVFTPIWLLVGGTLQALPPVAPAGDGSGRAAATEATA
jgi:hypothetical protein